MTAIRPHMSRNDDHPPDWLGLLITAIFIIVFCALLASVFPQHPPDGIDIPDDGCSSGVPQMGCFP